MKKKLVPPPRRLSLLSSIIILHSHVYAMGSWLAFGMGSLAFWAAVLTSDPSIMLFGYGAAAVFGGIGLLSMINMYVHGLNTLSMLRQGTVAYGTLESAKVEYEEAGKRLAKNFIRVPGMTDEQLDQRISEQIEKQKETEPENVVMEYIFSFKDQYGTIHYVEHKVKYIHRAVLEDDAEEIVLYNAKNPKDAIVYDAITNAPLITEEGRMGPARTEKSSVVIVPFAVIMVNAIFYMIYLAG